MNNQISQEALDVFFDMRKSPLKFCFVMWGLRPQPFRNALMEEHSKKIPLEEWKADMFGTYDKVKGEWRWHGQPDNMDSTDWIIQNKYITWQQVVVLKAVEEAIAGIGKKNITIRSGNGIGKSVILTWLGQWFLYCYEEAQIPCTANTSDQLHDVLWKEVNSWIRRLPEGEKKKFEWSQNYVRFASNPQKQFMRARTAKKDNPEALSGLHSKNMMGIIDEGSGVPDEVFYHARAIKTGKLVLFMMASNPTRLTGFFYRSQTKMPNWRPFCFSSIESPVVDRQFIQEVIDEDGKDSDRYSVFVLGEFPDAESVDDQGYVPHFPEKLRHYIKRGEFTTNRRLGVDPAGEGSNKTVWSLRDSFRAQVIAEEEVSEPKKIAERTINFMDVYNIQPEDTFIDAFGEGMKATFELKLSGRNVNGISVGDRKGIKDKYLNRRAQNYDRMRTWMAKGGSLVGNEAYWERELGSVKSKTNLANKFQIKPKKNIYKDEGLSPDRVDSVMVTFDKVDTDEVASAEGLKHVVKSTADSFNDLAG